MNAALTLLGFPVHSTDSYRYLVGNGLTCLAKRILPKNRLDDETISKCLKIMKSEYQKRFTENTAPYPGIPQLLSALQQRNIFMAVLSNKPDDFTQIIVKKLLPYRNFHIVRGLSDEIPQKPDPTAALQIADSLKIPPDQILYLGDTNTDMLTANAAGMFPVGALWGFRNAKELLESGARALVKKPLDVLSFIDNYNIKPPLAGQS